MMIRAELEGRLWVHKGFRVRFKLQYYSSDWSNFFDSFFMVKIHDDQSRTRGARIRGFSETFGLAVHNEEQHYVFIGEIPGGFVLNHKRWLENGSGRVSLTRTW
jgi:hypothetical protein